MKISVSIEVVEPLQSQRETIIVINCLWLRFVRSVVTHGSMPRPTVQLIGGSGGSWEWRTLGIAGRHRR